MFYKKKKEHQTNSKFKLFIIYSFFLLFDCVFLLVVVERVINKGDAIKEQKFVCFFVILFKRVSKCVRFMFDDLKYDSRDCHEIKLDSFLVLSILSKKRERRNS